MRKALYLIGSLTFLCLVALVSYLVTLQYMKPDSEMQIVDTERTIGAEAQEYGNAAGETSTKSVRLIYEYNEKKQMISGLILEVWDQEEGELSYVTIPADTGFTMSRELYQKLVAQQPELPQMGRLSHVYGYYEEECAFEYGCRIVEELVVTEITSYAVLPEKEWKTYFHKSQDGIWNLKKKYLKQITDWKMEAWSAVNEEPWNIDYYLLPGETKNAGYEPDRIRLYQELTGILPFCRKEE